MGKPSSWVKMQICASSWPGDSGRSFRHLTRRSPSWSTEAAARRELGRRLGDSNFYRARTKPYCDSAIERHSTSLHSMHWIDAKIRKASLSKQRPIVSALDEILTSLASLGLGNGNRSSYLFIIPLQEATVSSRSYVISDTDLKCPV